MDAPVRESVY